MNKLETIAEEDSRKGEGEEITTTETQLAEKHEGRTSYKKERKREEKKGMEKKAKDKKAKEKRVILR